jgi:hypothetical protein
MSGAARDDTRALRKQLADAVAARDALEQDNRRLSQSLVESEKRNSQLASLYVASYRLLGTLDREEVLRTIQEIVVNLIGSEEMAIFEPSGHPEALSLAVSLNVECGPEVPLDGGPISRVARTGKPWFTGDGAPGVQSDPRLTACIPLKLGDKVTGVLAIYRLLPQKPGLEPIDRELFELLSVQAATALYCTALHRREAADT